MPIPKAPKTPLGKPHVARVAPSRWNPNHNSIATQPAVTTTAASASTPTTAATTSQVVSTQVPLQQQLLALTQHYTSFVTSTNSAIEQLRQQIIELSGHPTVPGSSSSSHSILL